MLETLVLYYRDFMFIYVIVTYIFITFNMVCYINFILIFPIKLIIPKYKGFTMITWTLISALPLNTWFVSKIFIYQFFIKNDYLFAVIFLILNITATVLYIFSFKIFQGYGKRKIKTRCFLTQEHLFWLILVNNLAIVGFSFF